MFSATNATPCVEHRCYSSYSISTTGTTITGTTETVDFFGCQCGSTATYDNNIRIESGPQEEERPRPRPRPPIPEYVLPTLPAMQQLSPWRGREYMLRPRL